MDGDTGMKRSRFTDDQIIGILKEHEADISAADLCRKHGIGCHRACLSETLHTQYGDPDLGGFFGSKPFSTASWLGHRSSPTASAELFGIAFLCDHSDASTNPTMAMAAIERYTVALTNFARPPSRAQIPGRRMRAKASRPRRDIETAPAGRHPTSESQ
jgi:hypothetical protein